MSEVGYCSRNISYSDRPGSMEIILPPAFLTTVIFTGLACLYINEQYRYYKRRRQWLKQCDPRLTENRVDTCVDPPAMTCLIREKQFLNEFDKEVLGKMDSSFNRVIELARILLPAFWAMTLSSGLLLCGDTLFACIWPNRVKPSINTCLSCFLAPAGLVFALTFGFVFQMVLEKHAAVKDKITAELSLLDQLITMTTKFRWSDKQLYMAMLKAIKTELVTTSMLIQNRESSAFTHKPPPEVRVQIWAMLDLLQVASTYPERKFNMNSVLVGNIVNYLLQLNSICTDRMGAMHTKIHPMKWAFLEFLGIVSVFGVMVISAKSYKIELAFCQLTVFAVFMLFYLLADFDNAFNGFFRVDASLILLVVDRARCLYDEAARQIESERRGLSPDCRVDVIKMSDDEKCQGRSRVLGWDKEDLEDVATLNGSSRPISRVASGFLNPYPEIRLRSADNRERCHHITFRNSVSPLQTTDGPEVGLTSVEQFDTSYTKISRRQNDKENSVKESIA